MAKDLYAHHGMIPPSVHTELYYAQEMANSLYAKGEYDLGERLSQEIWDAGQWKSGGICNITNLFREQSLYHNGRHHDLSEYFTRDGCYPTATTQTIHYTLPEQTLEMGGISYMKGFPTQECPRSMRELYSVVSTVVLREMKGPYHPLPPGTRGVLTCRAHLGPSPVSWCSGDLLDGFFRRASG